MALEPRKLLTIFILSLVAFLVAAALLVSGALQPFELKAFDLLSRGLNPEKSAGDIVIVQIDQQSIDALSSENIPWPWPRQIYAPLIDYLAAADAVFMDILFTENSSYGREDDLIMAAALGKAGNVYLPFAATANKSGLMPEEKSFLQRFVLAGLPLPSLSYQSAVLPLDLLRPVLAGSGNVMMKPDPDGVYRRVPLIFTVNGLVLPHFVLGFAEKKRVVEVREQRLTTGNSPLPLEAGRLLLRFYRSAKPFPVISALDLLNAAAPVGAGSAPVSREYFKGKTVFVALTAAGLFDLKPVPVSAVATGALVHATTLDNLLRRSFIRPVSLVWTMLLMLATATLVTWFVLTHHSFMANAACLAAAACGALGIPVALFHGGAYLPVTPVAAALLLAALTATAYSYGTEGRQRRFVRRVFAQYMDEAVVAYLLDNPDLIKPGGRRERVTVLFADIAGFTTIAERFSPEETTRMLHAVLNTFSEVIIAHHGVIDKYIGDCIMAFWGAPLASAEDELNACRAAVSCQAALKEINARFRAEGLGEIAIRIGINSGDAIVGNLGSDRLFDYTVIGDTVNLASRLESANKFFRTGIMVSEDCLLPTGETFLARELGQIEVKGKSLAVRIYELKALAESADGALQSFVADFHRGLACFYQGEWGEAASCFEKLLRTSPDDAPTAFYLARCRQLIENPPLTDDWKVIKMTTK